MKQKAAIFDLDGTLIDSTWVWDKVDRVFQEKMAIQVKDDYYDIVVPMNPTQMAEYTIEEFNLNLTVDELKDFWVSIAEDLYREEVRLKEGAYEWLQYLKIKGVKLGIATSCFKNLCESVLKSNGVLELFDTICFTDEIGQGKEDAGVYLHCAKTLGVKASECMVFEDISLPLQNVKEQGMCYIGVEDKRQSEITKKELLKNADLYIESFCNLKDHPYFS